MISQAAEYALRSLLCLAESPPGTAMTTQQIAGRTRVPSGYLAKILQTLARAGLLSSQRGVNGGFSLAADLDRVTLLEVTRLTDASRRIATCPLGIHGTNLCPLHRQLDGAAAAVESLLGRVTLGELLREQGAAGMTAAATDQTTKDGHP
jgi:Rrf2 family protein